MATPVAGPHLLRGAMGWGVGCALVPVFVIVHRLAALLVGHDASTVSAGEACVSHAHCSGIAVAHSTPAKAAVREPDVGRIG